MMTLTLDTEGLEDPVVERQRKARGGLLVPPQHRRRMANVPLQTIGHNGAGNVAPPDSALQIRHRMLLSFQNQRGRRRMKVVSVHTQTVIPRRVLGLPRIQPLP